jgi:hypothetical protein
MVFENAMATSSFADALPAEALERGMTTAAAQAAGSFCAGLNLASGQA